VLLPQCLVVGPVEGSETPLLGNDDLLPSGELVSCSSESLHDDGSVLVSASDGHDDLTNVDSCDGSVGLTPSSSHTLLKPIGSGTGQHLVDSDNVERVDPDPQVESLFTSSLDNVLVGTNSSGFESFG